MIKRIFVIISESKVIQLYNKNELLINYIKTHPEFRELIIFDKPKFNIGDVVRKIGDSTFLTILEFVEPSLEDPDGCYKCQEGCTFKATDQDSYELISDRELAIRDCTTWLKNNLGAYIDQNALKTGKSCEIRDNLINNMTKAIYGEIEEPVIKQN